MMRHGWNKSVNSNTHSVLKQATFCCFRGHLLIRFLSYKCCGFHPVGEHHSRHKITCFALRHVTGRWGVPNCSKTAFWRGSVSTGKADLRWAGCVPADSTHVLFPLNILARNQEHPLPKIKLSLVFSCGSMKYTNGCKAY